MDNIISWKTIFPVLCSIFLILSACSSDQTYDQDYSDLYDDVYLKLDITVEKREGTRGVVFANSFSDGDEIAIVVQSNLNNEKGRIYINTKATYIDGHWNLEEPINLSNLAKIGLNEMTIGAIYPYQAIDGYVLDDGIIKIKTSVGQNDIMVGRIDNVSIDNPKAKIIFHHILTCLSLRVSNPHSEPMLLTDLTIDQLKSNNSTQNYLQDLYQINLDGDYLYQAAITKTSIKIDSIALSSGETRQIDVLLPATDATYKILYEQMAITEGGAELQLKVNGIPAKVSIPHPNWYPGKQYIYTMSMPEIGEIRAAGHEYIDLGLSVLWATCNVGANSMAESGNYIGWASTTDYPLYYDYSIPMLLMYDAITEVTGVDGEIDYIFNPPYDAASTYWGGAWRTPNKSEFQELIDNTSQTYETIDGITGYKITSKVEGFTDKYIFLPCSGYYDPYHNRTHESWSYYLTSTPVSTHTSSSYDMYMVYFFRRDDTDYFTLTNSTSRLLYSGAVRPVLPKE